jgi:hypothetical protein
MRAPIHGAASAPPDPSAPPPGVERRGRPSRLSSRERIERIGDKACYRRTPSNRSMVAWSAAGNGYFSNSDDATQRKSATRSALGA